MSQLFLCDPESGYEKKKMINSLISAAVWKEGADMFPCSGKWILPPSWNTCDKPNLKKDNQLFNHKNTWTTILQSQLAKVKLGFK